MFFIIIIIIIIVIIASTRTLWPSVKKLWHVAEVARSQSI